MDPAIVLEHISKSFAGHAVISDLSLTVQRGEIFGFLGPNGAGKTTTINMILGLIRPDQGRVVVMGHGMAHQARLARAMLGVVGEQQYLYDDMTAREYLLFFARLYGVAQPERRLATLMEMTGLSPFLDQRARDYSYGMKQKLGLARALLHQPDLLILDEPVAGLDPAGIAQVRAIVQEANSRGATIFLSSHILSEVERIAQRVAIINQGRLVAEGSVESIISMTAKSADLEAAFLALTGQNATAAGQPTGALP
jgi:ABC-2 type transport system ATP-binding protein